MSAMEWVLLGMVILLLVLLYLVYWRQYEAEETMFEMAKEQEFEHAKCLALVAAFVGDTFAAQVLIAAANDYDGIDAKGVMLNLRTNVWAEGGPSIPSLWLRDRAESILAATYHVDPEEAGDGAA